MKAIQICIKINSMQGVVLIYSTCSGANKIKKFVFVYSHFTTYDLKIFKFNLEVIHKEVDNMSDVTRTNIDEF